jgi:hypothetical protein
MEEISQVSAKSGGILAQLFFVVPKYGNIFG